MHVRMPYVLIKELTYILAQYAQACNLYLISTSAHFAFWKCH